MEVIFHLFKIVLSSNRVDLQLLTSKFCSFPAISLLFRLTQPSLAGTGADLGKKTEVKTLFIVATLFCLLGPNRRIFFFFKAKVNWAQ